MEHISSSLPTCSDSYTYRGQIKSLQDSADTTAGHVKLMLTDIQAICSRKADGSADDIKQQAHKLQQVRFAVPAGHNSLVKPLCQPRVVQRLCDSKMQCTWWRQPSLQAKVVRANNIVLHTTTTAGPY
eukprot:GHUV01042850.1.p1 GENE.GHUV01042850.1~~GHUV01042850.1.p1  ORF type:complete len:128 (-),score=30.67 GHUV01042850.1:619-1002(-)